ncbi:decapping endonuclease targeting mRNA [Massospora cicadina]|nr:decapping endonuclease targeting mRNA [Massospora cicadina]
MNSLNGTRRQYSPQPQPSPVKRQKNDTDALNTNETETSEVHFGALQFPSPSLKTPAYSRPREIGTFGYDSARNFVLGNQELRYYLEAELAYPDLSEGFDNFVERDSTTAEKFECLSATRFKNVLYVNEIKTEEKKAQERNRSERQKLMCYWGYKFEALSTICKPKPSDKEESMRLARERLHNIVNNHNEHCSVFKSSLDDFRLIMGAELLKFWAQSFLAGIPNIVVGFRDDEGKLRKIEHLKTLAIPAIVRAKGYWDPNVCLRFARQVLKFIVKNVTIDDPYLTYTITYDPTNQDLKIVKDASPSPHSFLTQAFVHSATLKYETLIQS